MTSLTTIKVSVQTRNRLKAQASAAHLSLGEHLAQLADAADHESRMAALKRAIAETPHDRAKSHTAETESWEQAELSDADDG